MTKTFRISLIWIVLVPFALIELALLLVFHFVDHEWHEFILFGASIVAGSFAFYTYLKGIEARKVRASEALMARWNNPAMAVLKNPVREITEGQLDASTLQRSRKGAVLAREQLDIRSQVVGMLGFYEEVALGIRGGSVDEDRLHRLLGAVVVQAWDHLKGWIENERTVDNEGRYYIELEWLAERWRK